jgi:hypothetical protein
VDLGSISGQIWAAEYDVILLNYSWSRLAIDGGVLVMILMPACHPGIAGSSDTLNVSLILALSTVKHAHSMFFIDMK